MINIIDNSNKKNFAIMSTEELVKFLNTKEITIEIEGEGCYRSMKVSGEDKDDAEVFEAMSWLIGKCNNNYFEFMKKLKGEREEEKKTPTLVSEPVSTKTLVPNCVHAYHSTNVFTFGGGYEVPYNIDKGEAYDDHGNIIASVNVNNYRNKGYAVPALHSKVKAALKKKLIADGNHDAALHL